MAQRIPSDFIDRLLSSVDVVEVVERHVPLRKVGREYTACCPFHSERTPSFTVSPTKQFYHCFGCGAHGNAIGFLMEYERLSFVDAVEELARSAGLEIPRRGGEPANRHEPLLALLAQAQDFFQRQLREHSGRQRAIDYLKGRGLDGQVVARFGIGYAPPGWDNLTRHLSQQGATTDALQAAGLVALRDDSQRPYDRFRDRIVFPIRDRRGRPIAFGGRILEAGGTPKYLNSPETVLFHKGKALFGLFEARRSLRQLPQVVVVEGYMDVVALAQHGVDWAVATLGTSATPDHLEQLFRLAPDVVFCFDGDRAGRDAAWRALENALPQLRDGRQASFLFLPDGEDPDSLIRREGQQAFVDRLKDAQPLSAVFFDHLSQQVDLKTLDGRARFAHRARSLLQKLPEGDFRDMMAEQLSHVAPTPLRGLATHSSLSSSSTSPHEGPNVERTSVRKAIALLLHQPQFALAVDDIEFLNQAALTGGDLLYRLIELVRNRPHIDHSAALLAHFLEDPHQDALMRLSQWRPLVEEGLQEEFCGIVQKLRLQYGGVLPLDKIIQRNDVEALSEEERQQLRRAIRPRSPTSP
ncbi:MAG: DNA primase [Candidatus Competibacterales bacterium]